MRNPEQVLNILAGHSNEPEYKYERLYRILFNEHGTEMYKKHNSMSRVELLLIKKAIYI